MSILHSAVEAYKENKNVKIGIIAVALLSAVSITYIRGIGEESIPDTDQSKTLWKCAACAHRFELTARQAIRAEKKAGGNPITCPHCDEIKAYHLVSCARCRTLFFGSEVPGESGKCPKCRPATQPTQTTKSTAPKKTKKTTSQPAKHPPKKVRPKSL